MSAACSRRSPGRASSSACAASYRAAPCRAIACHQSQARDNPVVDGVPHALVAAWLSAEHGLRHGCFCAHPYLPRRLDPAHR